MGRKKKGRSRPSKRNNDKDGAPEKKSWPNKRFILSNTAFECYYQAMGIVSKEEWPAFMKTLRMPLPACFRIHRNCHYIDSVKRQLHEILKAPMVIDGKEVKAVEEVPWYPEGLAFRLGCDRRHIRKAEGLGDFHKWLQVLTENGTITRQEAVSMLPPLFLDVQPGHTVLDMCAAPGSKTAQLLEMVEDEDLGGAAAAAAAAAGVADNKRVGLVVANEKDRDRAYLLSHQMKRVPGAVPVAVTWKEAQFFPNLQGLCDDGPGDGGGSGGGGGGGSDKGARDAGERFMALCCSPSGRVA